MSTRCPALSSTTFRLWPEVTNWFTPRLGRGTKGSVPRAAGENAFCGITPPGKTQLAGSLHPGVLYGSFACTLYPSRLESTLAQYEPFTVSGFPSASENAPG